MSELLANLISSFSAAAISDAFLLIIALVLIIGIYFSYHDLHRSFTNYAPNLLTSLGILGTFTGIVVGLMEFDPNNIDNSISLLLAGLKTAFLTSLFGMLSSIIFKSIHGYITRDDEEEAVDVGPEQIYQAIKEQSGLTRDSQQSMKELVGAIKGDEDSSLTSQIKNLRMDTNDANKRLLESLQKQREFGQEFQTKLWQELQHFGELLSKSATEQVINALKEVISDFNKNLTEQFGENFKRLDESVKKLVDWQENYRVQLEDMANKYQLGVEAISSTEQSVAHISERAESIPQTMEKLHTVMQLGHGQVTELEERLEAFKDLRDQAVEAMPQIKTQLDSTMGEISDSVKAASAHYQEMLNQSKQAVEQLNKASVDSSEEIKSSLSAGAEKISEQLNESVKATSQHYEQMLDQSKQNVEQFTKASVSSAEEVKNSLSSGAKQLAEELNNSVINIGGKLSEASQSFESNASEASSNMKNMNNDVTSAAETIRQELKDGLDDMNNVMRSLVTGIKEDAQTTGETLQKANTQLVSDTKSMRDETVNAIQQMQERLEGSLNEVFKVQSREIQRTFDSVEQTLTDTVSKTGSTVESQVEYLDQQMQQEINRVIELMGRELATVTQQFTRDYTELTNEMTKVVSRARQGAY